MQVKEYTEEINLQIDFLKKLKDDISDDSIKAKIDTVIGKIFEETIKKIDPEVRVSVEQKEASAASKKIDLDKENSNKILEALSKDYEKAQKDTRCLTYINLSVIIGLILFFVFLIDRSFRYSNDLLKSYLITENTKNVVIDSLYEKNLQIQTILLDRIDSSTNNIMKNKTSLNAEDSATLKFLDSIMKTLDVVETSAGKLESRTANFSKVQPLFYFHIVLNIVFIFAMIAVLVYLVRIFVNIHRYNHILADHYDALEGSFKTLKNKEIFGEKFDFEKAYSLMHPQKDKFIEMNAPVDMDTKSITESLKGLFDKFSISSKPQG